MALSGTRAAIGGSPNTVAGTVNVYDLAGSTPTVPAITLTNPAPHSWFGRSVAMSGHRLAVAAAGYIYVYDLEGNTPAIPVLRVTNGWLSGAVAISTERLVAGADTYYVGNSAGAAFVYDLASPMGIVGVITNPTPAYGDQFGWSVGVSGAYVVVGAPMDDTGAFDGGSVYVYGVSSVTPAAPLFTITSTTHGDRFGYSIFLSGTRLAIGSLGHRDSPGTVHVYELTGATPTVPVVTLKTASVLGFDGFGSSVASDGTTVLVGAPNESTHGANRGAAYVFAVGPTLRVVRDAPGFARISWTPANSPGFGLQFATNLLDPILWHDSTNQAVIVLDRKTVTEQTTSKERFYRLRAP